MMNFKKRLHSEEADWANVLPSLRKSLRRFDPATMVGTIWPQPAENTISYSKATTAQQQ